MQLTWPNHLSPWGLYWRDCLNHHLSTTYVADNLSPSQCQTSSWLSHFHATLTIKPADKNLGIVLLDTLDYLASCLKLLVDTFTISQLPFRLLSWSGCSLTSSLKTNPLSVLKANHCTIFCNLLTIIAPHTFTICQKFINHLPIFHLWGQLWPAQQKLSIRRKHWIYVTWVQSSIVNTRTSIACATSEVHNNQTRKTSAV